MKTIATIFALALMVAFSSCSKKNDNNVNPSDNGSKSQMVTGQWLVSYYFDSGKDETGNYNGYTFVLDDNGTLTATNGSSSFTGKWWIGSAGSDDDNSSNRFNIQISGNKAMEDITDDWRIVSLSDSNIQLEDDSNSGASIEKLHFARKNQ